MLIVVPAPTAKPVDEVRVILGTSAIALITPDPDSTHEAPRCTCCLVDGSYLTLYVEYNVLIGVLKTSNPAMRMIEVSMEELKLPAEPAPTE